MTILSKSLRRELEIADRRYTLTIDPLGLKLAQKGHRKGVTLTWKDLLSGNAALTAALSRSHGMNTTINQRCAHPSCHCKVTGGEAYCSEHCRKRVESPTSSEPEGCRCGHPACDAARTENGERK